MPDDVKSTPEPEEATFFPRGDFFLRPASSVLRRALVPHLRNYHCAGLKAMTITQLESESFGSLSSLFLLFGFSALAINTFHVGLPTCLTSVKPFQKGESITIR